MKRLIITACLCALLFSSCAPAAPAESQTYAMDTFLTQKVYGENAQEIIDRNCDDVLSAENVISPSLPYSDVYEINETGKGNLSEMLSELLAESEYYRELTSGAFSEQLGELTELWDIGGENERVPAQSEIDSVLGRLEHSEMTVDGDTVEIKNMKLNLGAIAKGYMLDRFAANVRDGGSDSALIDFGGSVAAVGCSSDGSPWTVGVNNPVTERVAVTMKMKDAFVSTSGSYQRYFVSNGKIYHHIMDSETGYPADNGLVSVSVVSDSGIETDALSTALFVMGHEKGFDFAEENGIAAVFIDEDGSVDMTSRMADYDAEKK